MDNPKTKALLIGGVFGAVAGIVAGLIYFNTNVAITEEGGEALEAPGAGWMVKLGLGVLGVLRLIAE